jgi:hypothetical protein
MSLGVHSGVGVSRSLLNLELLSDQNRSSQIALFCSRLVNRLRKNPLAQAIGSVQKHKTSTQT